MMCRLCTHFRDEQQTDGSAIWNCESPEPTNLAAMLMDDAPDCASFYPGSDQTVYVLGQDGEWDHRCKRMPSDQYIYWNEVARRWDTDDICPLYCPWCGTELLPMPEVWKG